jgi:hypothetical protein
VKPHLKYLLLIGIIGLFSSCSIVEKSSRHGFESGYYKLTPDRENNEKVYVDITDDQISVYALTENQPGEVMIAIPLVTTDSVHQYPVAFIKKSLDIDITTIPLKFRPVVDDLPPQLTADFNAALYFGWRQSAG